MAFVEFTRSVAAAAFAASAMLAGAAAAQDKQVTPVSVQPQVTEEADTPDVILQVGRGFSKTHAAGVANVLTDDGCIVDFSEGGLPGRMTLRAPSDGFERRYKSDQVGDASATFDRYCPENQVLNFPITSVDDISYLLEAEGCIVPEVVRDSEIGDILLGESGNGTFEVFTPDEVGDALGIFSRDCN